MGQTVKILGVYPEKWVRLPHTPAKRIKETWDAEAGQKSLPTLR